MDKTAVIDPEVLREATELHARVRKWREMHRYGKTPKSPERDAVIDTMLLEMAGPRRELRRAVHRLEYRPDYSSRAADGIRRLRQGLYDEAHALRRMRSSS